MKELELDLKNYKADGTVFNRKAVRAIISRKRDDGETELLMIHGKYGDYKFPGGGAEEGEKTLETLYREVLEESGYEVQRKSEEEYIHLIEKRATETKDILEMENYYYFCEISGVQKEQNLDEYEKDYEYKTIWITPTEAIAKNESVEDFEKIPWIKREAMVLREFIKDSLPVLETERLILRPLDMGDKEAVFAWTGDSRVAKYLLYSTYKSPDEIKYYVPGLYKNEKNLNYGIVIKETGELVGAADLVWERDFVWSLGYNLRFDCWGKGFVTEAEKAIIESGRKRFNIEEIEGVFAEENAGSRRVMEKLGLAFKENTEYTKWDGSATFKAKKYSIKFGPEAMLS